MMVITHTIFSLAGTALAMGSAHPMVLGVAALAAQLPDVDTSKSVPGRILFPISHFLEQRFPHRSVSHSFVATLVIGVLGLPLLGWWGDLWQALVLGYFFGWFGDVFTKSGVCAFFPSAARLVIPGNPRHRLSTGSGAEGFVLAVLVGVAIAAIHINTQGGILASFNATLGIPSGAIETVATDGNRYLMYARIQGRHAITQEPVDQDFEVIAPLSQNDLLVRDEQGTVYQAGASQAAQIVANRIQAQRGPAIAVQIQQIQLTDQRVGAALVGLPAQRCYLTGTVQLEDAEDLHIPYEPQKFAPISLQRGTETVTARLETADIQTVMQVLGSFWGNGTLIVRSIHVQS